MTGDEAQQLLPDDMDHDAPSLVALQQKLEPLRGAACNQCRRILCGHQRLFVVALGMVEPYCAACLAREMGMPVRQLAEQLLAHFRRRACYGEAWHQESLRESLPESRWDTIPECIEPSGAGVSIGNGSNALPERLSERGPSASPEEMAVTWDAGDLACGDLVLKLRQRLNGMARHAVLRLIASDPGAVEDIPAWCRLTGHRLLDHQHPTYWIQRKE